MNHVKESVEKTKLFVFHFALNTMCVQKRPTLHTGITSV